MAAVFPAHPHPKKHCPDEGREALIARLEAAHDQLLQSEKMAFIGQLAAGVAHEINNPVGYLGSAGGLWRTREGATGG